MPGGEVAHHSIDLGGHRSAPGLILCLRGVAVLICAQGLFEQPEDLPLGLLPFHWTRPRQLEPDLLGYEDSYPAQHEN